MNNFEINITYECNLSCKWCTQLCGTKYRKPDYISIKKFKEYIHIIKPYVSIDSGIRISGGEPTLHPQIFDILDILLKEIRPKMRLPISICSNGVGADVNTILNKIRDKYSTLDTPLLILNPTLQKSASFDFNIITSKNFDPEYVKKYHKPIFQAIMDIQPNINIEDIVKDNCDLKRCTCGLDTSIHYECVIKKLCGTAITPYGLFICAFASTISSIFKLGSGIIDSMITLEEEKNQIRKYCKYCWSFSTGCRYCWVPGSTYGINETILDSTPTKTYKKQLEQWDKHPYYLPVV